MAGNNNSDSITAEVHPHANFPPSRAPAPKAPATCHPERNEGSKIVSLGSPTGVSHPRI